MSDIVIKAENLSKYYKLGVINNGTFFRDMQTWFALKLGKTDPNSKIGEHKYDGNKEGFWALKDLNFEIHQGDRVGIIGKNGAGKSTLLKILSRITAPTEGNVKIKGRVASLLEVGTGFHGELTGRENIYLNGAILGMKRREVTRKLDEIIAFSEIEEHIDTPVKRYSSGMYVRLAFAVAAHLDSEILIADEVLAVGDAAFQKKALGKMNDLSSGEGRTVLFVSHQMAAVKNLCNKGIILDKGKLIAEDNDIDVTIQRYLTNNNSNDNGRLWKNTTNVSNKYFTPIEFELINNNLEEIQEEVIDYKQKYFIRIKYSIAEYNPLTCFWIKIGTEHNLEGTQFYHTTVEKIQLKRGENTIFIPLREGIFLPDTTYYFNLGSAVENHEWIIRPSDYKVLLKVQTNAYK